MRTPSRTVGPRRRAASTPSEGAGVGQYAALFPELGIDSVTFPLLRLQDLYSLGVESVGDRQRMLQLHSHGLSKQAARDRMKEEHFKHSLLSKIFKHWPDVADETEEQSKLLEPLAECVKEKPSSWLLLVDTSQSLRVSVNSWSGKT